MSAPDESRAQSRGIVPAVSVVVAIHEPVMVHVRRQIESLLAQEGVKLSIIGVLDGSTTAANVDLRAVLAEAGCDILVHDEAKGARAAFAAGLRRALDQAEGESLFAYCDQDDVWHPQKLSRLATLLGTKGNELAYCDARVVDDEGRLIAPSLHAFESREEPRDLLQHLLLNAVSGMTSVFTRRTAELASALLRVENSTLLHDHVTAIAASSLGDAVRLPEPLVDYVQHGSNSVGAKPHYRAWQRRTLGVGPLSLYRNTSKEMFAERRAVAHGLALAGVLPSMLQTMFLTRRPGIIAFEHAYVSSILGLLGQGQTRRAMLCVRMWDAAFSAWVRRQ